MLIKKTLLKILQFFSRRHQHYHSQRSSRNDASHNHQQRPISSYYEYETLPQRNTAVTGSGHGIGGGTSINNNNNNHKSNSPMSQWSNTTTIGNRNGRGPFVTQVTIRDQNHHGGKPQPPASQV